MSSLCSHSIHCLISWSSPRRIPAAGAVGSSEVFVQPQRLQGDLVGRLRLEALSTISANQEFFGMRWYPVPKSTLLWKWGILLNCLESSFGHRCFSALKLSWWVVVGWIHLSGVKREWCADDWKMHVLWRHKYVCDKTCSTRNHWNSKIILEQRHELSASSMWKLTVPFFFVSAGLLSILFWAFCLKSRGFQRERVALDMRWLNKKWLGRSAREIRRCNLTRAPNPDGSESRVVVDWYYGEVRGKLWHLHSRRKHDQIHQLDRKTQTLWDQIAGEEWHGTQTLRDVQGAEVDDSLASIALIATFAIFCHSPVFLWPCCRSLIGRSLLMKVPVPMSWSASQ